MLRSNEDSRQKNPTPERSRPVGAVMAFFKRLGPGLITGASDDDPSGIATYSQAGASYGYGLLWTMPLMIPLMAAVQEISARIGRITGHGIAGNIRRHYPAWLLYPIVFLLVLANTVNLGADIGAAGDAFALLIGGPSLLYAVLFALVCALVPVFVSYARFSSVMKWLTLSLFGYVAAVFMVHVPWRTALHHTLVPQMTFDAASFSIVIAILGTTISPYLFFWQAAQEGEEIRSDPDAQSLKQAPEQARDQLSRIRIDTYMGMTFSNLVAYFMIVCAAATLHAHGITNIETSAQAAEALRPLAGRMAFVLFSMGIVGTGFLAVPALAGSAAYAVGEALKWPTGLNRKPLEARGFYGVLITATLLGLATNFPFVQHRTHLTPIRALFWAAVINGIVAVPIMFVMMLMSHNRKVMGSFARLSRTLRAVGWLATLVMAVAAAGMFVTWYS